MAEIAAKVMLQAVKMGTDKVPDKYWERMPGMRPPKNEKEYKDTKAKVDEDEAKYGRFGSDKRREADRDRYGKRDSNGHRDDRDRSRHRHEDRHRTRRRSQSDERRNDRRKDRGLRAERRRLDRRASSYSPPHSEDEGFYNDAERRRQERRAQKYFCNDPSHQRWERRDRPAYNTNDYGNNMDRPYIPMPQAGGTAPPSPYAQLSPPGSAGGPPRGAPPQSYNPSAIPPQAPYGQQFPIPPPPPSSHLHPHPPGPAATASRPPSSFATNVHSPAGQPPRLRTANPTRSLLPAAIFAVRTRRRKCERSKQQARLPAIQPLPPAESSDSAAASGFTSRGCPAIGRGGGTNADPAAAAAAAVLPAAPATHSAAATATTGARAGANTYTRGVIRL